MYVLQRVEELEGSIVVRYFVGMRFATYDGKRFPAIMVTADKSKATVFPTMKDASMRKRGDGLLMFFPAKA